MGECLHEWSPRGDMATSSASWYGCRCGAFAYRRWSKTGLGPMTEADPKSVQDRLSEESRIKYNRELVRSERESFSRKQDEERHTSSSARDLDRTGTRHRFERLMGLR